MEEEQCPCDDCDATCDYWDSKYCCTYCRWQYGDIEPDCENCDPFAEDRINPWKNYFRRFRKQS